MNIFSSCLGENQQQEDKLDEIKSQPFKFKVVSSINLMDFVLKKFALPRKKEKYLFLRDDLFFVQNSTCQIPILYFPSAYPEQSNIIVYCHGSGSTLNNVYDFAYNMAVKFKVAFLAYDYTGDGESQREFSSYEEDLKLVLSFILKRGYKLAKTILCGFSLGSYSALCLEGPMPRILISPICGIISFFQEQAARYEGEWFDNIQKAFKISSNSIIFHCSKELVHISHGKLLHRALNRAKRQSSVFCQITNESYEHRSSPAFLLSKEGKQNVEQFLRKVNLQANNDKEVDESTKSLQQQMLRLEYSQRSEDTSKQKERI